jgi:hypothetical protein
MSSTEKPLSSLSAKDAWFSPNLISTSPLSCSSRFNSLTALAGTMNSPLLFSEMSTSSSTSASRRPSVATSVILFLEADENAVQHVARFVGGNGKGRFFQHRLDGFLGQRNFLVVLEFRQRRKFIRSQPVNFVKRRAAADAVMFFSSVSISISLPFNSRTMPKSFLPARSWRRVFLPWPPRSRPPSHPNPSR